MILKILIFCKYFYIFVLCLIPIAFYYEWKQEGFSWDMLFTFMKVGVLFSLLLFLSQYSIYSLNSYTKVIKND